MLKRPQSLLRKFCKRTIFTSSETPIRKYAPALTFIGFNAALFTLEHFTKENDTFWKDNFNLSVDTVFSRPHTIVTSAFVHHNLPHLLGTSIVLLATARLGARFGVSGYSTICACGILGSAAMVLLEQYIGKSYNFFIFTHFG